MKASQVKTLNKFSEYKQIKSLVHLKKEYDYVSNMMVKHFGTSRHKEWVDRERALCRVEFLLTDGKKVHK